MCDWCDPWYIICLHVQSDNAGLPLAVIGVAAPVETDSRLCELEDRVKHLERNVASLYMDNGDLTTKLNASREVERLQQEEITSLKERPVQLLRPQVINTVIHACSIH